MWLFTKKFYALGTHPEFGSGWSLINDCSLGVYDGVNITSKKGKAERQRALKNIWKKVGSAPAVPTAPPVPVLPPPLPDPPPAPSATSAPPPPSFPSSSSKFLPFLSSLPVTPRLTKCTPATHKKLVSTAQADELTAMIRASHSIDASTHFASLYFHQYEAVKSVLTGNHTLITTPTGSGKSLCYTLPLFLNSYPKMMCGWVEMGGNSIVIYPTKALGEDQKEKFLGWEKMSNDNLKVGLISGDIPVEKRRDVFASSNVIITNIDTLHHYILPSSDKKVVEWLEILEYIVVDEIHYYGENKIQTSFEGVMNRLRMRSPNQTFIATSATVTDASKLIKGVPFKEISQDTSGSGKQNYYATKSPIMTPTPAQQSPVTTVAEICLESYQCGLKVMAFGRTRGLCEAMYDVVMKNKLERKPRVAIYRGGYTPQVRKELEENMFQGFYDIIIGTSALELGIDIVGIDVVVILGTGMDEGKVKQMGGRCGRSGREGVVLQVCFNGESEGRAYDVPDICWSKMKKGNIRDSWADRVMGMCRAVEGGWGEKEKKMWGEEVFDDVVKYWSDKGKLFEQGGSWYAKASMRNANKLLQIRNVEPLTYLIIDINLMNNDEEITNKSPCVLDSVTYSRVFYYSFPSAIILHRGQSYEVIEVEQPPRILGGESRKECKVLVRKKNVSYRTEPFQKTHLTLTKTFSSFGKFATEGTLNVKRHVWGYRKIDKKTGLEIERSEIVLPAVEWDTRCIKFLVPRKEILAANKGMTGEQFDIGLHALNHAMCKSVGLFVDIEEGEVDCDHIHHGSSHILLYDNKPGSNGTCNILWKEVKEGLSSETNIFREAMKLLNTCKYCQQAEGKEFDLGCPSCIKQGTCLVYNKNLSRRMGKIVGEGFLKAAEEEMRGGEAVAKTKESPRKQKREHALAEARQLEVAKTRQMVVGRPTWELDGAKRWGDISDNFSKTYTVGKELQENSGWLNDDEENRDAFIEGKFDWAGVEKGEEERGKEGEKKRVKKE